VDLLPILTSIEKVHLFGQMATGMYVTILHRAFRRIREGEVCEFSAHKTAASNNS
jgi:hypothetical protein